MDNIDINEIFFIVDEFCKEFISTWNKKMISDGLKKRQRKLTMEYSEIMTIMILYHLSGMRNFKKFYTSNYSFLKENFTSLVSYSRYVEVQKYAIGPMSCFLNSLKGEETDTYIIDSTALEVCHIKREKRNKVFKNLASKSKSTMGWFHGFKLHLVINNKGELMNCQFTKATTDDRSVVEHLTSGLKGKIVGDKGYISKDLSEKLSSNGLSLITKIKSNMKNKLMPLYDRLLLKKRGVIETVNGQLKEICQIEHTRYRSVYGFVYNTLSALVAYCLKPAKPSFEIEDIKV